MCGFVGQLTFDAAPAGVDQALLEALADRARRRGPDDAGFWSDDSCGLAFRRLSILDLSPASHQPMQSADGRYVLVYNGELYNFRELRAELETHGVRFRSRGDTEVVLAALVTWGTAALDRFNGMFAFGLYDTHARRLLLGRDHAGMKPLYYLQSPHGVVFASQYDQILGHPWAGAAGVDASALGLYLRLGHIPAPYALLEGSQLLEPGAWLTIDTAGRSQTGRFFTFSPASVPDLHGEDAHDAVAAAVDRAVQRHLVADVPVGMFLSGGIDSPLIGASMRAATRTAIRAFTIGTGGDAHDESVDAHAYAQELGVEHIVAQLLPDRALDLLDDVVQACTEPSADYSIFPTLCVSQLARTRVTVALSGDGGDELFWGYRRFHALLARLSSDRSPSSVRNFFGAIQQADDPRWPSSIGTLQRFNHGFGNEGWVQRIFPDLPPWPAEFAAFAFAETDVDRTAQWLRWNELVVHLRMILQKVDRASMFHGLEVRAPLLDREVVAVAARIDWRTCIDIPQGLGKMPLRRALARRVRHHSVAKRGFTVPMDVWLRGPLHDLFADAVLARRELMGLPVDRNAVDEVFQRHCSGARDDSRLLWMLLSLALWERAHYRAAGPLN